MVLIISGIHEIFFSLWLAVITVRHHQIPVYILGNNVLRDIECILTFSDILDNGSIDTRFLQYFPGSGIFILFASFYSSFRQDPALILVFVAFVQQQDLPAKDYHTATARCLNHCNSSCMRCV